MHPHRCFKQQTLHLEAMSLLPIERFCTCYNTLEDQSNLRRQGPEVVELLWCFWSDNQNVESALRILFTTSSVDDTTDDPPFVASKKKLLIQNFEIYGWSPIRLRWSERKHESSSRPVQSKMYSMSAAAYDLLQQYRIWKQLHADLFHYRDSGDDITTDADVVADSVLRFVPSESGLSGTNVAEAKVSWEYQRRSRTCPSPTDVKASNADIAPTNLSSTKEKRNRLKFRLHAWTEILHTAICHVMDELELPTEHLIVNYHDTSREATNKSKNISSHEPIDLLRAFRYDPVSTTTDSTDDDDDIKAQSIGSSPHTDWGSWTVVWQDDTHPPCLQTYCYHCQKWNGVQSPPLSISNCDDYDTNNENAVNFIVHVGDITSLCIRHAIQHEQESENRPSSHHTFSLGDAIPDTTSMWPSPRHRVISPRGQYRHSLVYFVYPPPDTATPASITECLYTWCRSHYGKSRLSVKNHQRIPYEDYSLLCDQSATTAATCDDETTKCAVAFTPNNDRHLRQWNHIKDVPVRQIFEEKWKQVQR